MKKYTLILTVVLIANLVQAGELAATYVLSDENKGENCSAELKISMPDNARKSGTLTISDPQDIEMGVTLYVNEQPHVVNQLSVVIFQKPSMMVKTIVRANSASKESNLFVEDYFDIATASIDGSNLTLNTKSKSGELTNQCRYKPIQLRSVIETFHIFAYQKN